jgi:O-antigen/teichoic acid export membrane protein
MLSLFNSLLAGRQQHVKTVFRFFTQQGILQFLNILNGFFLLRWLSYKEQALFSIAFGIQTAIAILADMGFANSIISLTGKDIDDKKKVGAYIKSALFFSERLFIVITLFFLCFVPFQFAKQDIGLFETVVLVLPVMLSVCILVPNGFFQAPLLMHKQSSRLYLPQIAMALARLLVTYIAFRSGFVNAVLIVWLILISFIVQFWFTRKYSRPYIELPAQVDKNIRNELWKFIAPYAPVLIFYAFQGQINIFIISFFGKTQNIAEMGALSRLNQFYVFVLAVHAAVVVPFIARAGEETVYKKYSRVILMYFLFVIAAAAGTYFFPGPFLWILGSKYDHLRIEVAWMMLAGALSFLGAAFMSLNYSRKWVYWWSGICYITGLIVIQAAYVYWGNVSTTTGVLKMAVLSNIYVAVLYLLVAFAGFYRTKKTGSSEQPQLMRQAEQVQVN